MIFHTPEHPQHDYLFRVYFAALMDYAKDRGVKVNTTDNFDAHNDTVLVDTAYLTQEVCDRLRNNGNRLIGLNMIDSSGIAASLVDHMADCQMIFSLTGIQTTNIGHEVEFDERFQPKLVERRFLPEPEWSVFNMMRLTGRLHSLPYVHWERQPEPGHLPFDQKNGKVLVRGGAHFRRVVLAFFLMRAGLLDENSGFPMKDYFQLEMADQFRFCQDCRGRYFTNDKRYAYRADARPTQCNSPAQWGAQLDLSNPGAWNNRCPASFYWLADQFQQQHGPISPALVEDLFNTDFVNASDHQRMLRQSSFTADLKWIHSIYVAQRFWDAAICGTVNLLPSRTMDQEYFPEIKMGDHYSYFPESMEFLNHDLKDGLESDQKFQEHIVGNAWSLYTQWIRPTDYKVNTNLLAHILERIEAC